MISSILWSPESAISSELSKTSRNVGAIKACSVEIASRLIVQLRFSSAEFTRPLGIGIDTTFSLSLGRVASELASLRGEVSWSNPPKSSDICHRSPLLAEARLSQGRVKAPSNGGEMTLDHPRTNVRIPGAHAGSISGSLHAAGQFLKLCTEPFWIVAADCIQ
jgi:hypothetical protein